jgi:predicted Fe-S protein YdhL (DUF1289 family)
MTFNKDIVSPCIRNCCLDDYDICVGCGRSLSEITRWGTSNNMEKQFILSAAAKRRQLRAEGKDSQAASLE